ncbi:MAG: type II secretion system protein M [Betaproteobacteria bacterium]|nr:type II secretion system protein M [Betaproteobacteria bacterium]
MKVLWDKLAARLDRLANRERMLVFAGGLALIFLVVWAGAIDPVARQTRKVRTELASASNTAGAFEEQRVALEARSREHPDDALKAKVNELDGLIGTLEADIGARSSSLVAPERMPALVRDLVARSPGIELRAMRTLPAAPLLEQEKGDKDAHANAGEAGGLFKHGIELTVQGAYPALVDYCSRLQAMPVRVVWSQTRVDASAFPRVSMTLTLFTLGLDRTWMTL